MTNSMVSSEGADIVLPNGQHELVITHKLDYYITSIVPHYYPTILDL